MKCPQSIVKLILLQLAQQIQLTSINWQANKAATFAITDIKLFAPVVTLSTQENTKLVQHFKAGFKSTISYQSKESTQVRKTFRMLI